MQFKVKIGTARYLVRTKPHFLRDDNAYAMTEYAKKLITIDEDLLRQPDLFVHSLMHEINHAILHEYGVRIEDKQEEEYIVDLLAMGLVLLRENKTFMKVFKGEIK
jgi:Zn-dependent peptidase ImmA (M78 family)